MDPKITDMATLRTCSKSLEKYIRFIFQHFVLEIAVTHSYPSDLNREQFDKIKPTLQSARQENSPLEALIYMMCSVGFCMF